MAKGQNYTAVLNNILAALGNNAMLMLNEYKANIDFPDTSKDTIFVADDLITKVEIINISGEINTLWYNKTRGNFIDEVYEEIVMSDYLSDLTLITMASQFPTNGNFITTNFKATATIATGELVILANIDDLITKIDIVKSSFNSGELIPDSPSLVIDTIWYNKSSNTIISSNDNDTLNNCVDEEGTLVLFEETNILAHIKNGIDELCNRNFLPNLVYRDFSASTISLFVAALNTYKTGHPTYAQVGGINPTWNTDGKVYEAVGTFSVATVTPLGPSLG